MYFVLVVLTLILSNNTNILFIFIRYGKKAIDDCKVNLVEGISKPDLIGELHERGVSFLQSEKKDVLVKKLEDVLSGIHHVPALLFQSSLDDTNDVGLGGYEVLPVEPLHTIAGHIKNLYEEIPCHVSKTEKSTFKEAAHVSFAGKEVKRAADYRKSLVDLTIFLKDKFDTRFVSLLRQLCEIQQILYAGEDERSLKSVLRLHNLTFSHATMLWEVMGKPKTITSRRLFGQYYHALISHALQQYRLMPLTSANTEDEERAFNFLKEISKHTSNHHADNVLLNSFIKLQVRE